MGYTINTIENSDRQHAMHFAHTHFSH